MGLLERVLLTDVRRTGRFDEEDQLVLLEDQRPFTMGPPSDRRN